MALLFLDPLVLGLLLALVAYVGVVWSGRYRRWFGRPERWTVLAWPLPVLLLGVPLIVTLGRSGLDAVGFAVTTNGALDATLYAAGYLVPLAGFLLVPPRWLLPPWARARLAAAPAPTPRHLPGIPEHALPAVNGAPGHGSLARWSWRVDGVPGYVWRDGDQVRFRSDAAPRDRLVDDAGLADLRLPAGDTLRLESPRGGLWTAHHVDVDLAVVDWTIRARRPWRRDGLLVVEVAGRRPLHLWVTDVRWLSDALCAPEPVA